MDDAGGSTFLLSALIMALVVFLVCRELICWYWKINEIAHHLKVQRRTQNLILHELRAIREGLGAQQPIIGDDDPQARSSPESRVAARKVAADDWAEQPPKA